MRKKTLRFLRAAMRRSSGRIPRPRAPGKPARPCSTWPSPNGSRTASNNEREKKPRQDSAATTCISFQSTGRSPHPRRGNSRLRLRRNDRERAASRTVLRRWPLAARVPLRWRRARPRDQAARASSSRSRPRSSSAGCQVSARTETGLVMARRPPIKPAHSPTVGVA